MSLRDELIERLQVAWDNSTAYHEHDIAEVAVDSLGVVALVEALENSNDVLLATFANISNPDNHDGWCDTDALEAYQANCAALSTIKQGE